MPTCPRCGGSLFSEHLAASGTEPAHRELTCLQCGYSPVGPVLPYIAEAKGQRGRETRRERGRE